MKTFLVSGIAFALAATAGQAQDIPDHPVRRGEVIAAVQRQFARIDANRDGIVTRAEFEAFRASPAGARAAASNSPFDHVGSHWFDHADADGSGRITVAQATARPLQMFDTADVNGDGVLSVEELRMAEAMRSLTGR